MTTQDCAELTYVLITPYSLLKSRTGGIIGRLLALSDLDFVAARMYAPSDEFVDKYCDTVREDSGLEPATREALLNYINDYLRSKNRLGISNRTVLLLFRGPDAARRLNDEIIGPLTSSPKGDTIRGTFGDFIGYASGELKYFEPAVLNAASPEANFKQLNLLADYAASDGGILEHVVEYDSGIVPETTLVILKPENFWRRSTRAGNIIDIFSKTGLFIVGAKLLRMTVAQAREFYGPLRRLFVDKLKTNLAVSIQRALEPELPFSVSSEAFLAMAEAVKEENAEYAFNQIVKFMTGLDTSEADSHQKIESCEGERCLALLYQGENAIEKIRDRLGSTDPTKAAEGTVRSDFGSDIMKNGAHASDSSENAERERRIIGMWENEKEGGCDVMNLIEKYLQRT